MADSSWGVSAGSLGMMEAKPAFLYLYLCSCPYLEPSDSAGRECLQLLQQLHQSVQKLWEVTEENLHALQERLRCPTTIALESLSLLRGAERILQVHME